MVVGSQQLRTLTTFVAAKVSDRTLFTAPKERQALARALTQLPKDVSVYLLIVDHHALVAVPKLDVSNNALAQRRQRKQQVKVKVEVEVMSEGSESELDTEAEAMEVALGSLTPSRARVFRTRREREERREQMFLAHASRTSHSPAMWHAGPLPLPVDTLADTLIAPRGDEDEGSLMTGYMSEETTGSAKSPLTPNTTGPF